MITGASGFVGKHLLYSLIQKYGIGYVLALTSKPINGVNFLLHNNYDFPDNFFLENGFENIEIIIHAGAFTPKNSNEANNISLCNSNIFTTEKVINSKLPRLKKIIYLSTLDVYGIDDVITERSPVSPATLYGLSKFYCEKTIDLWCNKNNIDFLILRIGHVYGPGEESYQKLIPLSILKILNNQKLQIFGDGGKIRSYIYIDDVVQAIVNSIDCSNYNDIINVVSGNKISVIKLIDTIAKISNIAPLIESLPENLNDRNLIFDNSKMVDILKISETSFNEGIEKEFNYMRNLISK